MSAIKVMSTVVAALALAAAVFLFGGFFDVRANTPHSALTSTLLHATMEASAARGAREIVVPEFTDEMARAGASDYVAMCAGCHGAPGVDAAAFAQGLNPMAPDLSDSAEHLSSAELFWITRNGIRMTGMPAWSATHPDADLWPVVAFVATLPDMTAEDYETAVADASGSGHHSFGDMHGASHSNDVHETAEPPADAASPDSVTDGSTIDDAHEHDQHEHASGGANQSAGSSSETVLHAQGPHDH